MLRDLLKARREAILEHWVEDALASYSPEAVAAFGRETDRFANPVGHSLRVGTGALFDALLDAAGREAIVRSMDEIVRIRAVQQMSPSAAVGFVFGLKHAIRAELGEAVDNPVVRLELRALETRIDGAALSAFDLFVEYRERVSQIRIDELKRTIPWLSGRTRRAAPEGKAI